MLATRSPACDNPAPANGGRLICCVNAVCLLRLRSGRPLPAGVFLSMKLVPLGDKVIIRRLAAEEKTAGGILLPDSAREKPQQGRVVSVGDGALLPNGKRSPLIVQEGDRVVFHAYAGS